MWALVANSNPLILLKPQRSSASTWCSSQRHGQASFDFKIPILIGAVAVVASEPQEREQTQEDFQKWILEEVVPRHSDTTAVINEVVAKARQKKVSELEVLFPVISRMVLMQATELLLQENYDSVMALLDAQWELSKRVDGLFRFPREMSLVLGLEADVHKGKGDFEAMRRSKKMLWMLLQRYDWLGESDWGPRMRRQLALSLAVDYSTAGDCDTTKYLLQECVHFARLSGMDSGEESLERVEESANNILELLSTSLRSYYFMKRLLKSPCAPLFEYAARDVYDLVFALDPKLLPFWHDLKVNVRRTFDGQIQERTSQKISLKELNPAKDIASSVILAPLNESMSEEDERFSPSSLLLQPRNPTL